MPKPFPDIGSRPLYGGIAPGIVLCISLAINVLSIVGFSIRLKRNINQITIFGFLSSIFITIGHSHQVWIWHKYANNQCKLFVHIVFYVCMHNAAMTCLFLHFLQKARVLNFPRQSWTWLQVLTAVMIPMVTISAIVLLLTIEQVHNEQACVLVPRKYMFITSLVVLALNHLMPAVGFMHMMMQVLVEPQAGGDTLRTRDKLVIFWRCVFCIKQTDPTQDIQLLVGRQRARSRKATESTLSSVQSVDEGVSNAPSSPSKNPDITIQVGETSPDDPPPTVSFAKLRPRSSSTAYIAPRPIISRSRARANECIIRLIRRVFIATSLSFIVTCVSYITLLIAPFGADTLCLWPLEASLTIALALVALPLPKESGKYVAGKTNPGGSSGEKGMASAGRKASSVREVTSVEGNLTFQSFGYGQRQSKSGTWMDGAVVGPEESRLTKYGNDDRDVSDLAEKASLGSASTDSVQHIGGGMLDTLSRKWKKRDSLLKTEGTSGSSDKGRIPRPWMKEYPISL